MPSPQDVTQLLVASREGAEGALDALLPLVYDELHAMAAQRLRRERVDHTLQATALVNEAWLKLVDQREQNWANRSHFLALAATVMRRVLVNHAEGKRAAKRGGERQRVTLDESSAVFAGADLDVLVLDEALTKLSHVYPDKARLVELRFFVGLSHDEIAEVMGTSTRTVERSWRLARAWLQRELGSESAAD